MENERLPEVKPMNMADKRIDLSSKAFSPARLAISAAIALTTACALPPYAAALQLSANPNSYKFLTGNKEPDGTFALLLFSSFVIAALAYAYYAFKLKDSLASRIRRSQKLLARIKSSDPAWDPDRIKDRIKKIYFAVHNARIARDHGPVKEMMSERLFQNREAKSAELKEKHIKSVLEEINLLDVQLVSIEHHGNDPLDRICALITDNKLEYTVDDRNNELVGYKRKPQNFGKSFIELWKFIKDENGNWILDETLENFDYATIASLKIFSEIIPRNPFD